MGANSHGTGTAKVVTCCQRVGTTKGCLLLQEKPDSPLQASQGVLLQASKGRQMSGKLKAALIAGSLVVCALTFLQIDLCPCHHLIHPGEMKPGRLKTRDARIFEESSHLLKTRFYCTATF